ncbi:hypothetical protein EJ02DRAFT_438890 [Clathrospora elynae]|uniref:Uncharacterized protein n=1 Tax=Clathrospora elynae TaxID=706981 RepID=A0A6A5S8J2_9PLEO|nr:hypothetical protein EJ02DRAFT_438890 [Clathrospora elynae]
MSKRPANLLLAAEMTPKKQKVVDFAVREQNTAVTKASTTPGEKSKRPPPKGVAIPPPNLFWGMKPLPGGPRPDPVQPSARDSNGATHPPMWEDRKYRFKRGSRYVKYFGPIAPENLNGLPETLDQEELLVIPLIDMRPKCKKDPTPRRTPLMYTYGGKPKDWNHMQSIKALNDRRYQGIDRTTVDAPWTRMEREYLASLLGEFPDASIWDLTEQHNDRFMGKDFVHGTGFPFANLSTGRTVESIRYEYTTYKPAYDQGQAPDMVRFRNDFSTEGKTTRASKRMQNSFGLHSKALELAYDKDIDVDAEDEGAGEDNEDCRKTSKKAMTKTRAPKKSESVVPDSGDEGDIVDHAKAVAEEQKVLTETSVGIQTQVISWKSVGT